MKQLVCSSCGWKSEIFPDGANFFGPGGELPCPECTKAERNRSIEVYGNADVVDLPPFKGWKIDHSRRRHMIHYFENGKAVCGSEVEATGEYLIKEHYAKGFSAQFLKQAGKQFCQKCETKLASLSQEGMQK